MGTTEIIIVFSALMALIAFVTIGIDWIGKPLKHRRFISRMYRFEDEKLPLDPYGNPTLGPPTPAMTPPAAFPVAPPPVPYAVPYAQPQPVVVARLDERTAPEPTADASPPEPADQTVDATATTAFSHSLTATDQGSGSAIEDLSGGWLDDDAPPMSGSSDALRWTTGMALDATILDEKPNLSTKAERFWANTAADLVDSHFDADNLARMRDGKAPRRTNPRTGRTEAMQLTGLRQASERTEVRMRWPGESVDPWNAS